MKNVQPEILIESKIEKAIRRNRFFVLIVTLLFATMLYWLIIVCQNLFISGQYWAIMPASFFAHSFLIVTIHEAAHQNVTRTKWDRLILNLASSLAFLPIYGEYYRKYHLTHHRNTNLLNDPISPPLMRKLFKKNRILFILIELIPIAPTTYLMISFENKTKRGARTYPPVNHLYFFLSIILSLSLFVVISPNFMFLLGTLFLLNIISTIRNWCEHMGTDPEKSSNTYWFPLGMGIGNHQLHHDKSSYSWISLMIGLFYKKTETNPFKCIRGILFDKSFGFYDK